MGARGALTADLVVELRLRVYGSGLFVGLRRPLAAGARTRCAPCVVRVLLVLDFCIGRHDVCVSKRVPDLDLDVHAIGAVLSSAAGGGSGRALV